VFRSEKEQLLLDPSFGCACWIRKDSAGLIVGAFACPECVERALAYLEDLLYLDSRVSVSGSEAEAEKYLTNGEPA